MVPAPLTMIATHDASWANIPVPGSKMERAASQYGDGEIVGFETVAKHVTPELACIVEVERYQAKVGGREDSPPWPCASRASLGAKAAPGRSCIGTQTP